MMVEISIIIPFYNREDSIRNAIESVLNQGIDDIELLLIDDGSNDSSVKIVNSIEDSRIRLIRLDNNQGAQKARNIGIQASKSEWITFLDSDDVYLPNSLLSRYKYAKEKKVKIVHSNCLYMKNGWKKPKKFNSIPLSGNVYLDLLKKPGPTFPALFVEKDTLLNIGYLDEEIMAYQEWDTSIRLAKEYDFAFLRKPTFIYNIGTKNSISKNIYKSAKSYLQIVKKHEPEILRYCGEKTLADHYCYSSQIFYKGSYKAEAILYLNKALLIDPINIKYRLLSVLYHSGIKFLI